MRLSTKCKDLREGGLKYIASYRANALVFCKRSEAAKVAGCWKIHLPEQERVCHRGRANLEDPAVQGK